MIYELYCRICHLEVQTETVVFVSVNYDVLMKVMSD